jgi:hypothetical protein
MIKTGFILSPKTEVILAPRGWRNMLQVHMGIEKKSLTTFFHNTLQMAALYLHWQWLNMCVHLKL